MTEQFERTARLIGRQGLAQLQQAHVLVAGVGGVGSFAAEALVRAGVGALTIVDNDVVDITNLNRQIHATHATVGRSKVEVMAERLLSIQPELQLHTIQSFLLEDTVTAVLEETAYSYIIDAVDTVSAKLGLIVYARERGIPVISSMGTANKLDATKFEVVDISKTHTCPLARVMRRELKNRGILSGVEVLYSTARPVPLQGVTEEETRPTPGSISYVPSVAGLLLAGHVIQKIIPAELQNND